MRPSHVFWTGRAAQAACSIAALAGFLSTEQWPARSALLALAVLSLALAELWIRTAAADQELEKGLRHELEDIEQRFSKIFMLGPAPMAISRLSDGTFVHMNQMYLDYFGWSREEMLEKTSRELGIISDAERTALISRVREAGRARNVELHTRTKSGEERSVLFSSEILPLDGEQHMLSILYDVTERDRAEKALRQSEAELAEAQQIAKLGVWTLDVATDQAQWSVAFARIHGQSPAWRSGKLHEYLDLVVSEDRQEIESNLQAIRNTGKPNTFDYRIVTPDGETRWMNVRMDLLRDSMDRPFRLRGITQDITDRIRLETQLRRSQKLDAVGQLAGGIAHDLNNILGVVVGHLGMAEEDLPAEHPVQENLKAIKNAAQRGTDLVRRIVNLSSPRMPEGRSINTRAVIEEVMALLRATLPAMIEIRAAVEDVPAVKGDSTQFHQIIMNLVTNAAHAMEHRTDGLITIELKAVHVDADMAALSPDLHEGKYARLAIADNGSGMDRHTVERIFEPFFTTKGAGKGTGLGLAIVHGIVRSHGGAITVYSEQGRGTTFRIYLPVWESASAAERIETTAISPGKGEHILCVDDEEPLLEVLSILLGRMGYRITKFLDPLAALEAFEAAPDSFNLVMTDHAMPGLTGTGLARRIRAVRPAIPMILSSGHLSDREIREAEELELFTLTKPASREEIGRLLETIFSDAKNLQDA